MSRDSKLTQLKLAAIFFCMIGLIFNSGCSDQSLSNASSSDNEDEQIDIDDSAYERAKEILNKYPEDPADASVDGQNGATDAQTQSTDLQNDPAGASSNEADFDDTVTSQLPEDEATQVMEFVDEATLEIMSDGSKNKKQTPVARRMCDGDGIEPASKKYLENVQDDCLLPKMQVASQLFSIRYTFARCIFEQENPRRDRLAHNRNGNGLAQIVQTTMIEVNKRWMRGDALANVLKECLQSTSNRHESFLNPIDKLFIPTKYDKSEIYHEAAHRPPSHRVNPLYRDDSVCLGLMTMAIKVQEANGRKNKKAVSDKELARRYNGSKFQQRYARAIVKCVARYKKGTRIAKK